MVLLTKNNLIPDYFLGKQVSEEICENVIFLLMLTTFSDLKICRRQWV